MLLHQLLRTIHPDCPVAIADLNDVVLFSDRDKSLIPIDLFEENVVLVRTAVLQKWDYIPCIYIVIAK